MIRRGWSVAVFTVAAVVGCTLMLAAQTPSQGEFLPVKPGELGEQLPAARLVFAGYAFVWAALVVYVYFLWRRITRVERDLAEVSSKLQAKHS